MELEEGDFRWLERLDAGRRAELRDWLKRDFDHPEARDLMRRGVLTWLDEMDRGRVVRK